MTHDEISLTLRTKIAEVFDLPLEEVPEDALLADDLDADSIDLLELVLGLRDIFGITIREGEVKELLVELARFLPDVASEDEYSDEDLAEITRKLRVATIVEFVEQKVPAA